MAAEGPRVLVVEDDPGIADAVAWAMDREGMASVRASTIASARVAVTRGVDLAILDLGLPDGSGFTLLREWRASVAGPAVIVLTSRDDEVDCVASLEAGADDFVAKPFSPRTLVARARAVLRRREQGAPVHSSSTPSAESPSSGLSELRASLVVDVERRTVTYAKRAVDLTKIEFDLLAVLAQSPGRVLTREQLVRRVWGDGYAISERTIDSHVKALRRKLGEAGASPALVAAVRGVGFKMTEAT
ncbi:MAG TPA: response regulator transcription factor [Polyangiaceae bacterium]